MFCHDINLHFELLDRLKITPDVVHEPSDLESGVVGDVTGGHGGFAILAHHQLAECLETTVEASDGIGSDQDAVFFHNQRIRLVLLAFPVPCGSHFSQAQHDLLLSLSLSRHRKLMPA